MDIKDIILLTPKEVSKILGCSLPYVYKIAERKLVPCVRIPCPGKGNQKKTMVRFKQADLISFIEGYYNKPIESY